MTFEEVDACTGPAVGWPKSATFRTADIVGLDILMHVVKNIYETAPDDESRERLRGAALRRGYGAARLDWRQDRQGFYKKVKGEGEKEILTLDLATMEYRPRQKARFASIEAGKAIEDTRERLRALVIPLSRDKNRQGPAILWGGLSEMCLYAGRRMPEISDYIVDVDRAMRWGFAWELGPFETVGRHWASTALRRRSKKEGNALPPFVEKLLAVGRKNLLRNGARRHVRTSISPRIRSSQWIAARGIIILKSLKEAGQEIEKNSGASLIDLGDGVVCCEFHAKMNAIGGDLIAMIHKGLSAWQRISTPWSSPIRRQTFPWARI